MERKIDLPGIRLRAITESASARTRKVIHIGF
jgi:hypothetical protein